ncbi:hypothetical protein GW17_00040442 [Ensete ventricosum]|nr:hypothetical protein GW17_00040442 [Ensete ventricosum]
MPRLSFPTQERGNTGRGVASPCSFRTKEEASPRPAQERGVASPRSFRAASPHAGDFEFDGSERSTYRYPIGPICIARTGRSDQRPTVTFKIACSAPSFTAGYLRRASTDSARRSDSSTAIKAISYLGRGRFLSLVSLRSEKRKRVRVRISRKGEEGFGEKKERDDASGDRERRRKKITTKRRVPFSRLRF